MKIEIPCTEAARKLGDCLERIRYTSDSFVLTKNKMPVAELLPLAQGNKSTLGEMVADLRKLPSDPGFASDLKKVNRGDEPMDNPWS